MFSGSHIDKNMKACVRPRGKSLLDKIRGDPAFRNLREGRRSGLPPSNSSEKAAKNRGSAYHESSNQQLYSREAPERPPADRPRRVRMASAGRSNLRQDDHAPCTNRASNAARDTYNSYAPSEISDAQDYYPPGYFKAPRQQPPKMAYTTAGSARIKPTSKKSGSSRRANSHHHLENQEESPTPAAYSHEEHEPPEEYEYERMDPIDEVLPEHSISVVGTTHVKKAYTQSVPGIETNRNGLPRYMPPSRSKHAEDGRPIPYNTATVTPSNNKISAVRSMYEVYAG